MQTKHTPIILVIAFFLTVGNIFQLFAQLKPAAEKCGFDKANHLNDGRIKERMRLIDNLIQEHIQSNKQSQRTKATFVIPVIVHIIHNGEPVGKGANIAAKRVYAQIEALNDDFNKTNLDLSNLRSDFTSLTGDAAIEFRLAAVDPDGQTLLEPGIIRHYSTWSGGTDAAFDETIKKATYFDPYKYMNIWVAPTGGSLLGVAQFPKFTNLEGLEIASLYPDETDGVWVGVDYFGASHKADGEGAFAPFDKGRTLTHEVGHWLGLLHIWGSGGCASDDYVTDTPTQNTSNSGCPSSNVESCGGVELWENFMDYTNDACMVMFTAGQVERMRGVLEVDRMRSSMINAGTATTEGFPTDVATIPLGYASVRDACVGSTIDFKDLSYVFNADDEIQSIEWEFEGGLPALSHDKTPSVEYFVAGTYDVQLTATSAKGSQTLVLKDYITIEDRVSKSFPLLETFEGGLPSDWQGSDSWEIADVGYGSNKSIFINHFNNDYTGIELAFSSPVLATSAIGFDSLLLRFDLAYMVYGEGGSTTSDSLAVAYQLNCTDVPIIIWKAGGTGLATVPGATSDYFEPSSNSDWENMELKVPVGEQADQVIISFISKGDYGNPIYIDNIYLEGIGNMVTGVEEEIKGKVTVYPNPSEGHVVLEWEDIPDQMASIQVLDLLGREVYKASVMASERSHVLNLENLPASTYIVRLRMGNAVKTKKIFVQK